MFQNVVVYKVDKGRVGIVKNIKLVKELSRCSEKHKYRGNRTVNFVRCRASITLSYS